MDQSELIVFMNNQSEFSLKIIDQSELSNKLLTNQSSVSHSPGLRGLTCGWQSCEVWWVCIVSAPPSASPLSGPGTGECSRLWSWVVWPGQSLLSGDTEHQTWLPGDLPPEPCTCTSPSSRSRLWDWSSSTCSRDP